MAFCKDCKHIVYRPGVEPGCAANVVYMDLVRGLPILESARDSRCPGSACGIAGKLFEKAPPTFKLTPTVVFATLAILVWIAVPLIIVFL